MRFLFKCSHNRRSASPVLHVGAARGRVNPSGPEGELGNDRPGFRTPNGALMKISFLIHTIYGIGGTIRTTLNLAEEFAGQHEVEIVSVFRHRPVPLFDVGPRITLVPLI